MAMRTCRIMGFLRLKAVTGWCAPVYAQPERFQRGRSGRLFQPYGMNAEAQLAKQGTYSGKFGWYAVGKGFEIEKGHEFWVGEFSGTFFNDAGEGFMHETSWVCPGVNDVINGVSQVSHGYCVITDKDGDKAFLVWKAGKGFEGDFQWTGGTGKYTGITGNNAFTALLIGPTPSGYSLWKGEWKLP